MMELIEQLLARIVVLERWRETLVLPEIAAGNVGDLQVITADCQELSGAISRISENCNTTF